MTNKVINININRNVTLELFMHENEPRPTILLFPGGGYDYCSERESNPIANAFFDEGYNAAILRYSVGEFKNFAHALDDANEAMSILSSHTSVKSEKIAVIGFSAGGHLAASLSLMGTMKPSLCILGYPATLKSFSKIMRIESESLHTLIDKSTPPTFIFSTFEDQLVPIDNTTKYIEALELNDVPFEAHIFQKGKHGLALGDKRTNMGEADKIEPAFAKWFPLCMMWLKENWGYVEREKNQEPSIRDLMVNETNKNLILEAFDIFESRETLTICRGHTLDNMNKILPDVFTLDKINELKNRLIESAL